MKKQFIVMYFRKGELYYSTFENKEDALQFKEATNGEMRELKIK